MQIRKVSEEKYKIFKVSHSFIWLKVLLIFVRRRVESSRLN